MALTRMQPSGYDGSHRLLSNTDLVKQSIYRKSTIEFQIVKPQSFDPALDFLGNWPLQLFYSFMAMITYNRLQREENYYTL